MLGAVIGLAAVGESLAIHFGCPRWAFSMPLAVIGSVLYFANVGLIKYYIKKNAPEFANALLWNLTTGAGVVPKWVSFIGLAGCAAVLASAFPYWAKAIGAIDSWIMQLAAVALTCLLLRWLTGL